MLGRPAIYYNGLSQLACIVTGDNGNGTYQIQVFGGDVSNNFTEYNVEPAEETTAGRFTLIAF